MNDPTFVRPIPRNSWGGASQALTALRAPRWMEHYGKPADLACLMQQWVAAILRAAGFWQQMDPMTGAFSTQDASGYSPAALVLIDFTLRLHGVRTAGDEIEWNVRPWSDGHRANFRLRVDPITVADLKYESGWAELRLNDHVLLRTSSTVRLLTGHDGTLHEAIGIGGQRTVVELQRPHRAGKKFAIEPNQRVNLKT